MPRRIRVSSIKKRVSHLRRQSHLLHHFRIKATLAILLALAIVLGVHAYVEDHRVSGDADDPEVVVGTTLRARLNPDEVEGRPSVMDLLEESGVRPTLMQTMVITCESDQIEVTAADAAQYRVVNEGGALMLLSPDGQNCGKVQRIFLPADENAVKAPS